MIEISGIKQKIKYIKTIVPNWETAKPKNDEKNFKDYLNKLQRVPHNKVKISKFFLNYVVILIVVIVFD